MARDPRRPGRPPVDARQGAGRVRRRRGAAGLRLRGGGAARRPVDGRADGGRLRDVAPSGGGRFGGHAGYVPHDDIGDRRGATPRGSGGDAAGFALGALLALVVSSIVWPVWTHLPVRRAVAAVYGELASYLADAERTASRGSAVASATWTDLARQHHRLIRDAIENARSTALAGRARRQGETRFGGSIRALLGAAEVQFPVVTSLVVELESAQLSPIEAKRIRVARGDEPRRRRRSRIAGHPPVRGASPRDRPARGAARGVGRRSPRRPPRASGQPGARPRRRTRRGDRRQRQRDRAASERLHFRRRSRHHRRRRRPVRRAREQAPLASRRRSGRSKTRARGARRFSFTPCARRWPRGRRRSSARRCRGPACTGSR